MKLLDLFCGAGGAAMGYFRAGFTDITGIDNRPQPRYPFKFIHADALEYLKEHGHEYDVIHASPPCQAWSAASKHNGRRYTELIEPIRKALTETKKPFVIENVFGSPLINAKLLCGAFFSLTTMDIDGKTKLWLKRHRFFESSQALISPGCHCYKYFGRANMHCGGVYGGGAHDRSRAKFIRRGGYTPNTQRRKELMGIDWMKGAELSQAIPPPYTEFIGKQLLENLK